MQEKIDERSAFRAVLGLFEIELCDLNEKVGELDREREALNTQMKNIQLTISMLQEKTPEPEHELSEKSIPDAVKILLDKAWSPMKAAEIVAELERVGRVLNTENKTSMIGSILHQRETKVGDIVRPERGMWGLAKWNSKSDADETILEGETEPPSSPPETVEPQSAVPL